MAVNWTREQRQVIESRNRNLLVSAAAGSGKTAVLVERIVRMVTEGEHPLEIDRLLVMTFTRAAAAEMRERIQEAIEKKLEEQPESGHLQRQAVMAQYARITTIDSFCLYILKEHFDRLHLDPAFRVGDEGEMLLMRADVMRDMLEDYYENGKERYEAFVDAYAVGKADAGIDEAIFQVYAFSQSNPWPGEWLARCREELADASLEELNGTEWMRFLLKDAAMQAEEWVRELSEAARLCEEEDGPQPYLPAIREDLSQISRILACTDSYEAFSRAVGSVSFSRLAAIRGKKLSVNPEKKERVADCRKRVKKAVERLREEYLFESPERVLRDLEESRDGLLMLLELTEEFSRRFQEKKKEKNVLDFNDLEHFALEALTEPEEGRGPEENRGAGEARPARAPGPVADELSRQFDEILVDEYQDSNLVQETLIQYISRERFGQPNVFMVGDVKQSIYKFRLARPELFLEKYDAYTREDGAFQKIELHQNFRSRCAVLDSVNDVFYCIMTKKLGGIAYTEETALHAGAVFEEREGLSELQTELLLIDTAAGALEELDEDLSDYTARELEAGMIAGRIKGLVDPENGITVWDKEEKRYRRARYGDIVILLRSVSGWAESFCEVLGRHGIPAAAESRTGYFTAVEVETVLNLLAVIDNPIQDIPLAAVLKSPIGALTDEELAHLASWYKAGCAEEADKGLYRAVKAYLGGEDDVSRARRLPLLARLKELAGLYAELKAMAVYLPMHELLYRIYDRTGYYSYVSAMPGGEARRANLDMLVEKAAAYESTSYRGVFHFIRYIEKLKKYNTDFGEARTQTGRTEAVRIMSIHKSKGLEFPIVFVAAMAKQFNKQDTRGTLLIDADLGIGTDYLDPVKRLKGPTLKKNVMKRRMELDALGEELRVLYVAMTRAREKLILTASVKGLPERLEKWNHFSPEEGRVPCTVLTLAGSYLDWILMSMRASAGTVRINVREEKAAEQLTREIGAQLARRDSLQELFGERPDAVYDEDIRGLLTRSFTFRYPFQADMVLNTKMSVSELKRAHMEEEEEETVFLPTLPAFMGEEDRAEGGTTRGNAYHRLMQLLPLEEIAREDISTDQALHAWILSCLRRFQEEKRITEEAASLIQPGDIVAFLKTGLGRRMCRAAQAGRLSREQPFVIGIPAREMGDWDSDELVLIQGIIDAFFEEDGELVVIDYKTDYARNEEILKNRYEAQIRYYERALCQISGKRVRERCIYSYRLGEIWV
ncbi:MAG: helicase-exonuclease AddAB subunit AddA [Clostridium sp.]|nr:helicase-exonuclease AddAB subunit AddA [Clostridium sp.]